MAGWETKEIVSVQCRDGMLLRYGGPHVEWQGIEDIQHDA